MINENEINTITNHDVIVEEPSLSSRATKKRDSFVQIDEYYFHNIQFSLLYLTSFFIVGFSCIYYFSCSNYNNRIILPYKENEVKDFPYYTIVSKNTHENQINIELALNFTNKNENILFNNLNVTFIFDVDRVNFKISSNQSQKNIEPDIYDKSDVLFNDRKITNYRDSNIGIKIYDMPFNFELYRKDENVNHEVLFDSTCKRNQNLLFFSKNYIQLCTNISSDSYSYGFNESLFIKEDNKYLLFSNQSDTFPYFISYNPNTSSSFGLLLLNSGPVQINVEKGQMSYEMINGDINFFLFAGPNMQEIVMQMQKTISFPILPRIDNIDWNFFNDKAINIRNEIDLENKNNKTELSIENINTVFDSSIDNNASSIFLDPKLYSPELNDITFINYLFIHKSNLLIENSFLLNYLNILGLIEGNYYYHLSSQQRPMIVSTKSFFSSSAYLIKWIKDTPFSFEGMKNVLVKIVEQSLMGNPYTLITFSKDSLQEGKENKELMNRWCQLLSLLPLVDSSEIINEIQSLKYCYNTRYRFSPYIYSYYIISSVEGGAFPRPLFVDFKPKILVKEILKNQNQLMIGSNIMIVPITEKNTTNFTCLFPDEKFYDYYTGEVVNKDGEGQYFITNYDSEKLPIFMRGGKITPLQLYDISDKDFYSMNDLNVAMMSELPLQILICLDNNFQASGRLMIDDYTNQDARNKKIFYKMFISATQRASDTSIFFKVYSFKYKLPETLFKNTINKVVIYGFSKISVKKLAIMNKNGRVELDKNGFSFFQSNDILTIQNISIPLDMDTKILIL